ncbi:MAG: hypothetical protein U0V74_00235 [Chitinophagales bacterium]
MNFTAPDLLTIQKFVTLLDDFYYNEFCLILQKMNARLPLKLTETIREGLPNYDSHEELCRKVYGGFDKNQRQTFNQLASYTFKLSAPLVRNYPNYLLPNINKVQQLICEGRSGSADFLAKTALDIAEQIENYQMQIMLLKILVQQSFHRKDFTLANKYNEQLAKAYASEVLYNEVLTLLRHSFYESQPRNPEWYTELKANRNFCEKHFENDSLSIRMLSKYAYVYLTYHFIPEEYTAPVCAEAVTSLERDLVNYGYVAFHPLFDIASNLWFLKLNSPYFNLSDKDCRKDFDNFVDHYTTVKFWNNYLNIPEMLAITIKVSYYLSANHFNIHRADYKSLLADREKEDIANLIKQCERILAQDIWSKHYKNDFINLKLLYGALHILSGGEANIKKGLTELEATLVTFQQVNFTGSIDSAFLFLMIGYFSLKQYSRCSETFKRYIKITKGNPIFEDNDIGIHTYYYLANWLASGRKQYVAKLNSNYERSLKSDTYIEPRRTIEEFAKYFSVPLDIKNIAAQK